MPATAIFVWERRQTLAAGIERVLAGGPVMLREVRDLESIVSSLASAPFPIIVVDCVYAKQQLFHLLEIAPQHEAIVVLVNSRDSTEIIHASRELGVTAWFDRPPTREDWARQLPRWIATQQDRAKSSCPDSYRSTSMK